MSPIMRVCACWMVWCSSVFSAGPKLRPPANPAAGDRYILPSGPTSAWAGFDDSLAHWEENAWRIIPPNEGWVAWDQNGQACKTISQCIFGIYLFHMPFLALAAVMVLRSTDRAQLATISAAQTWMIFTLTAIFSIIFAQLLLRYIEIPIMKLLRRLSS
jgi:hypothetical protein